MLSQMDAAVAAYLERIHAAVLAGGSAPLARLGKVGPGFEPSAELLALLGGRALELPPPRPDPALDARGLAALTAWQAQTLDWLLRGTVAPVGDLGLLCVRDDVRLERDAVLGSEIVVIAGQHVGLRPSPRLAAAFHAARRPRPADDARVRAALAAMPDGPAEIVAAEIPALLQRAADQGEPWSVCVREERADPFVYRGPPAEHDCRLHRVRLSAWVAAMKMAAELDAIAPADLGADQLAAIAEKIAGLGRPAGELAELLWRGPRWRPMRPALAYADEGVTVRAVGDRVRLTAGRGMAVDVPIVQIFDAYPLPMGPATWLRLWGCFDSGVVTDLGPLPPSTVDALAAHLRLALGLPRGCEVRTSLLDLAGGPVARWVDLVTTWPHVAGVKIVMPPETPRPDTGAKVRLRGLFEAPPGRLRVLQWTPA